MHFEKIAPYLQNPFVLAGFVTMFFIGVVTLLVKKGIIRLTRRDSALVINKVLLYGFIIALVAIGAGVVMQLMNASSDSSATIPDTIKGLVEHHDGFPATGARVELLVGETPMVTNTDNNGRFEFEKSTAKTAHIKIFYANKELIHDEIVIEKAVKTDLFYKLPAVKAPFSITYLNLPSSAIHFLVKGRMEELSEQIFKYTKVIPNDIYQQIQSIYNKYGSQARADYFTLNGETKYLAAYPDVKTIAPESFYGKGELKIFGEDYSDDGLSDSALAVVENGDWGVYTYNRDFYDDESFPNNLYISPDSFYFEVLWRFTTAEDFRNYCTKPLNVYKKVTENDSVQGFGLITLASNCIQEEDCGGPIYPRLKMSILLPMMKIQVAKVKNISKESMFLEQFILRENDSPTLRYYSDDIERLKNAEPVKKNLFTQVLEPQHSVLLPLKICFEYPDEDFYIGHAGADGTREFIEKINEAAGNQINSTSRSVRPIRYGNVVLNDRRKIRCPILVDVADRAKTIPEDFFRRKFVYGKSISIKDIQVKNTIYFARQYDPKRVTIEDGIMSGSCPYIFTYNTPQNIWVNEGHILYAVNNKGKERYDEKRLFNYSGNSIILKELEPETSYIDHLYIRAVNSSGKRIILPAKHELLYQNDSQYLVTDEGDEIKISFAKLPDKFKDAEIFIVAKGYYIPHNRKPDHL